MPMDLPQSKSGLSTPRILLLSLSFVSVVICALSATAHYAKWVWGNSWQPVTWLLSMLFLLLAFLPEPRQISDWLRSFLKPKTTFFLCWILVFAVSHLWKFSTALWNGDGLFDDSAVDLLFLKSYVIGHPFQPAWFHSYPHPFFISRETLFHYYVWGFLYLFGFNILAYEAALFVLWCTAFLFTLLLIDLLFRSNVVTSVTGLIANFFVLSFVYTFVGYRYPMTVALCVTSLYFLHLGFRTGSCFSLSLGGISAGLGLASSIIGKQYLLALVLFALLYGGLHWKSLGRVKWSWVSISAYGFATAAMPILCYIVFNRQAYTYYEAVFMNDFWQALRGCPPPNDIRHYASHLWSCFFSVPGPRLFTPDVLPIALPYYLFLLPGFVLAILQKRYEIALLGVIPVLGVFVSGTGSGSVEHRLLLAIPFWIILMGFTFASLLELKLQPATKIPIWGISAVIVMFGLAPSVRYIYSKTKNPRWIRYYAQDEVAVSRFLRNVVAGKQPPNPPRLEHDEFNRIEGIPDAPYETFICQGEAYSIIQLFLHDYDEKKILSFCGDVPFYYVIDERGIWSANKKAVVDYVPSGKDLKLIWERHPKTDRITNMFEQFRNLGTEESISYSFGGRERKFYVLNIGNKNISQFQERVRALPDSLP